MNLIAPLTRAVIARPRAVLITAGLVLIVLGWLGAGVGGALKSGGSVDPAAESARAQQVLEDEFGRGGSSLVLTLTAADGADPAAEADYAARITERLRADRSVQRVISAWSGPAAEARLTSSDGRTRLIVASIAGGSGKAPDNAQTIVDALPPPPSGIALATGGETITYRQINEQSGSDLVRAELVALPLAFLVLVWAFGGLVAAAVPVALGVAAIIATSGLLRLVAEVTDVSVFALNLITAMSLALAIDYTLLVVSRYREEVSTRGDRNQSIVVAMTTAGRTVVFSAVTVGLSLAAMVLFPMYFLRSFAYAGLVVVGFTALATLIITPAVLTLLGDRIDKGKVGRGPKPADESRWYDIVRAVQRRAVPLGIAVVVLLLVLGAPFLSAKLGYPDDRVLPREASSHRVGDELRGSFTPNPTGDVLILLPDGAPSGTEAYAQALSQVERTGPVTGPDGTWLRGERIADGDPTARAGDRLLVTVTAELDPMSEAGRAQLDSLRAVPPPGHTLFAGAAQADRDAVDSILGAVPRVLLAIAITTAVLLFLLTGSVLLPLKALVMNILSLSATFGAMVWIFQWGNLGGLGTTVTGHLIADMPVLMFCIAFGLSMDYEVFLLSRIKEEWDGMDAHDRAANDEAVARGIASTARVVTAAALLMAVVFAAIGTSQVSFMKMLGVGLALAVILDATLVRMVLVPAFMKVAGTANWWPGSRLSGRTARVPSRPHLDDEPPHRHPASSNSS
ncbi:MMPL domain protein OS=Tsukamurella paurometabola (strain ATCC 8368 / DSM / CCUG 35730 / CIP 100753 / JCM 10117 / KCTC 9821 / NBRC 16120 / NCIMB 702349/ NCTC 13040) OX=521096 GN=Tpau_1751 PE=4 SV=1 [Tsukamurella paurometabola]|uniref:MMPL domain protein n=1 Tax=Tsukamurella paurometabola (strain ATCC 8368 / DSM 20162 / CCUG 35730 / CIP 100753 / JCM 10117 / KCTC 9821 / NBRC 16120 / NCIMB 702349 / NCTC 13040) TaxID=521096 RepID=D5UM89_TSUPD|nr:MMPL family transporter [Tsukamurella paurometabola]ADG78369.1 MMPL domain protein [Tsukamurella paurometabola DSM 20162]SUP31378.1 Membrane transport protein mmpL8 [Tsukamurella paurometabola]